MKHTNRQQSRVTNESVEKQIRDARLKCTPNRVSILRFIMTSKLPVTGQALRKMLGDIDEVTIYRNLNTFEKVGLIRRIDLRSGSTSYEYTGREDHHHITCLSCRRTFDFHGCEANNLMRRALREVPAMASIDDHSVELFGTCKKCCAI